MYKQTRSNENLLERYLLMQVLLTLGLSLVLFLLNSNWLIYAVVGGGVAIIGTLTFILMTRKNVHGNEDAAAIKIIVAELVKFLLVIILLGIAIVKLKPGLGAEGMVLPGVFLIVYLVPIFASFASRT